MDNNLHYMRVAPPVLAPIFRSDAQARLLSEILLGGEEVSLSDLSARTQIPYATAHREVSRLLAADILAERTIGRTRLLSANPSSPLVAPLREILAVSTGPAVLLKQELLPISGIEAAFLYGSFAARLNGVAGAPPADIDLMVIGDPDAIAIYDACDRVEKQVGRPVNPTILSSAEAANESQSGFLATVRQQSIVPLLGEWS